MLKSTYAKILDGHLLPFLESKVAGAGGHRFQQDNDPKYTSRYVQNFVSEHGVNWWRTPAESPDLNPIEHLWNELKCYLAARVKPFTKADLIAGIHKFWSRRVSKGKCRRYIEHTHKVIPKVIAAKAGPSGE